MAHFAELDDNNCVLRVVVVDNTALLDGGSESEAIGIAYCQSLYGEHTRWVQTSYSCSFRKNFAGPGSTYDVQRDAFIPEKLLPSWVLNESTCKWEPPVPYPSDGKLYAWSEENVAWVEIVIPPELSGPEPT